MCQICILTQTFDPTRHSQSTSSGTTIFEGIDAAENASTNYTMTVGDTFRGDLSNGLDEDWVRIDLARGTTYEVELTGITLGDTYLRVFDSGGFQVAFNDDGGPGLNSRLTFDATYTGAYYIEADAYSSPTGLGTSHTGTYELTVTEVLAPPSPTSSASLDTLAEFLTEGYWPEGREFTFNSTTVSVNITALSGDGQRIARQAMDNWEMVSNIRFVEVSFGEDITFDDEEGGAFAYRPGSFGVPNGVELNFNEGMMRNQGVGITGNALMIMTHEIGHAIGLGHQGDYNGAATYGINNNFVNDSLSVSVMSYFTQSENIYDPNSRLNVVSTQMADILAIQNLYGENRSDNVTAGDTTWGQGSNIGNHMDDVFDSIEAGNHVAFTIYDQGGTDHVNLGYLTSDANIDLTPESYSDFDGLTGIMAISRGTILEDVTTGEGNDTVTGNDARNTIILGLGNDEASGGVAGDRIEGGGGFDTISGDGGNDILIGEDGADSIMGGSGGDRIEGGAGFDNLFGDAGNDTILAGDTADRAYGGDGDDVIRAGANFGETTDGVFGEAGNDSLYGEAGFDLLDGGSGDDFMDGGNQADNLRGGTGNDTLFGGLGLDRLFGGADDDLGYGGEGNDGMFGEGGNDVLYGEAGNDRFFGGGGDDSIFGGSGEDTINAGGGFDTIDSGSGNDVISGRANADLFVFRDGHGSDEILDFDATNDAERIDFSQHRFVSSLAQLDLTGGNGIATQINTTDVFISTGGSDGIMLRNVQLSDLDSADFVF